MERLNQLVQIIRQRLVRGVRDGQTGSASILIRYDGYVDRPIVRVVHDGVAQQVADRQFQQRRVGGWSERSP